MPPLFGKKEPEAQPSESAPPPVVDSPVSYAKAEDVTALQGQLTTLNETIAQLRGALEYAARPQATAAPAAPVEPDITDDELNRAISDEQNPAQAIRKLAERMSRQTEVKLKNEVQALKSTGLGSITRLVEKQATSLPYFKDYEKEIRGYVSQVPVESQADFATWELAHNVVVGMNHKEIAAREQEAEQRRAREASAARPNTPGQRGTAAGPTDDGAVAPEDFGNTHWLNEKGVTPEGFVRSLTKGRRGKEYKDWNEYLMDSRMPKDRKGNRTPPDDGAKLGPMASRGW